MYVYIYKYIYIYIYVYICIYIYINSKYVYTVFILPKFFLALFEVVFAIPQHPREDFRDKITQFGTNPYVADTSL